MNILTILKYNNSKKKKVSLNVNIKMILRLLITYKAGLILINIIIKAY
jgi:hypothetical protein